MSDDEKRVESRKMARARREAQLKAEKARTKKKRKLTSSKVKNAEGPVRTKRKTNRAASAPVETSMKLGRSLRTGGAFIMRVSKKAYKDFNTFTQSSGDQLSSRKAPVEGSALRRNMTFIIFGLTVVVIMSIALMVLNNSSVSVDRVTVSIVGLDSNLEGYNILHISDLHGRSFGTNQTSLLRTINGLSYNLVVFTGDMVGRSNDPQPFYDLLEGMTANRPRYFISGDSDPQVLLDTPRDIVDTLDNMVLNDWVLGAKERGATYLSTTMGVSVGTTTLWLSPASLLSIDIPTSLATVKEQLAQETDGAANGVITDYQNLPLTDYRYRKLNRLDQAVHNMTSSQTHIALSHVPPTQEYIEVTQMLGEQQTDEYAYLPTVDLVLAGHYCGGGWKLPFIGAIYVPNSSLDRHGWFPSQSDVEGLKQLGSTLLYTSPGLSVTDKIALLPNFRLFNEPKITILTLTSAITNNLID
ncbi:MAG: metallophosphoesterase [Clostridia bacterium]|nr:metallophosphoesterase [Clostridia bacterium]